MSHTFTIAYYSEFVNRDGSVTRWEILRDTTLTEAIIPKGGLSNSDSQAVRIEWNDVDKTDAIHGAALTLKVESSTDRMFLPLWHTKAGSWMFRLKRDGDLVWQGFLDTEQCEEPYVEAKNYDVSLTFSDFAPLDNIKYAGGREVRTIADIIDDCLSAVRLDELPIEYAISTRYKANPLILSDIAVQGANFFDEDDEPATLDEVLEGVLQPLGLHIMQVSGRIRIFDLEGLRTTETPTPIYWDATDQKLGCDTVYNDVTVRLSPYAKTALAAVDLDPTDMLKDAPNAMWRLGNNPSGDNVDRVEGFRLYVGDDPEHLPSNMTLGACGKLFKIESEYSGQDTAGVAYAMKYNCDKVNGNVDYDYWLVDYTHTGNANRALSPNNPGYGVLGGVINNSPLFTLRSAYLPAPNTGEIAGARRALRLRVKHELLLDPRYNFFESAAADNEEGHFNRYKKATRLIILYARLLLKDAEGNVLYEYDNTVAKEYEGWQLPIEYGGQGGWKVPQGNGAPGYKYLLMYYDYSDPKDGTALNGFTCNKRTYGMGVKATKAYPASWAKIGDGDFIPLPPAGGYLELSISMRHEMYKRDGDKFKDSSGDKQWFSVLRWMMTRNTSIDLVKRNGKPFDDDEAGDIVDEAWLDRNAKDGLSISTIVGTPPITGIAGRGQLLDAGTGAPVVNMTRAGVTDRIERLLIGTAYSQHATRHLALSGTARCEGDIPLLYTDEATPDKVFMAMGQCLDLPEMTNDVRIVELSPEEYSAIEYK